MFTLLLVFFVSPPMAGLASQLPTAPPPREVPVFYYPTKVGAKWVYQRTSRAGGRWEEIEEVLSTSEKTGVKSLIVGRIYPDEKVTDPRLIVRVSDKGVSIEHVVRQMGDGGMPKGDSLPLEMLRLPHHAKNRWEDKYTGFEQRAQTQGYERVTVPAGTFDTLRVDYEWIYRDGSKNQASYWYARGVGPVKKRVEKDESILKSFTVSK